MYLKKTCVNEPKFLLAPNILKLDTRHTTEKHTTNTFSRERTPVSGTNYWISNQLSHQPIIFKRHFRYVRIRQSANDLQWEISHVSSIETTNRFYVVHIDGMDRRWYLLV